MKLINILDILDFLEIVVITACKLNMLLFSQHGELRSYPFLGWTTLPAEKGLDTLMGSIDFTHISYS